MSALTRPSNFFIVFKRGEKIGAYVISLRNQNSYELFECRVVDILPINMGYSAMLIIIEYLL